MSQWHSVHNEFHEDQSGFQPGPPPIEAPSISITFENSNAPRNFVSYYKVTNKPAWKRQSKDNNTAPGRTKLYKPSTGLANKENTQLLLTHELNLQFDRILRKKIYRNAHGILAPKRRGGNGHQIWKAADNMRKKQLRTADKGDPPVWGFGDDLKTAQTSNKNNVTDCLVLVTSILMSYTPRQVMLR